MLNSGSSHPRYFLINKRPLTNVSSPIRCVYIASCINAMLLAVERRMTARQRSILLVNKRSLIVKNNLYFFQANFSFRNSSHISGVITELGECLFTIFPGPLVLGAFAQLRRETVSLIVSVGPSNVTPRILLEEFP